jgi:hypothetical protein
MRYLDSICPTFPSPQGLAQRTLRCPTFHSYAKIRDKPILITSAVHYAGRFVISGILFDGNPLWNSD